MVPEEAPVAAAASAVDSEVVGEGEATMMAPQTMSFVSGRHFLLLIILSLRESFCVRIARAHSHSSYLKPNPVGAIEGQSGREVNPLHC